VYPITNNPLAVMAVCQGLIGGILRWPSCDWHMASYVTSGYLKVSFSW